jgi:hypothetical protein
MPTRHPKARAKTSFEGDISTETEIFPPEMKLRGNSMPMIDPHVYASARSTAETEMHRDVSQLAREYDFIVCGAGSSGSVVARRLAEATLETQVDGDFKGWEGETVVKLMNGQVWQQTEYHYEYHYAYMPKVLIFSSGAPTR